MLRVMVRRSYIQRSVHLVALASLALLASTLLFTVAPWLNDDLCHSQRKSLGIQFDSLAVDHAVVFITILPPLLWLLLSQIAYSHTTSWLDIALLVVRVTICVTATFALTVLLTEFFSRRATVALGILAYASIGLLYSWSVPIWKWYQEEVRHRGLVRILPKSMQELLLETSLLEWLTDTTLSDKVAPFLPFLLPLTKMEQIRLMEQMAPEAQVMLTKPGLLPLLPYSIQKVLLPAADYDSEQDEKLQKYTHISDKSLIRREVKELKHIHKKEISSFALAPSVKVSGFDFHLPYAVPTVRSSSSRAEVLNDIVTSRVWHGCKDLMSLPSPNTLHRTAAVSSALLVMQLYASKGSRKAFVLLVQCVASWALTSVACCAIFLRLVQLLDSKWTSGRSVALLYYVNKHLLRYGKKSMLPPSDPSATARARTLRAAVSSVSVAMAAFYVCKKFRR